jgi:hypothetical protein
MVSQVKLDGPVCDYEGLMQVKRRIVRQIFDAAGHRSLDTQAYKVQMLLHLLHCACHVGCLLAHFAYRTAMLILVSLTWVSRCKLSLCMPALCDAGVACLLIRLFSTPDPSILLVQEWFACNEFWLVPYAAFCFLRDLFGTAEHWRWGTMSKPTPEVCSTLCVRLVATCSSGLQA